MSLAYSYDTHFSLLSAWRKQSIKTEYLHTIIPLMCYQKRSHLRGTQYCRFYMDNAFIIFPSFYRQSYRHYKNIIFRSFNSVLILIEICI